jgi:hypothetical protein
MGHSLAPQSRQPTAGAARPGIRTDGGCRQEGGSVKRDFPSTKSHNVFGQARKPAKMFRAGLCARVSTNDQQTLSVQSHAMREYAGRRGWTIAVNVREVGSVGTKREARE